MKWCDSHGWSQSNQTGAGNATTGSVEERVEGGTCCLQGPSGWMRSESGGLLDVLLNYRRELSEHLTVFTDQCNMATVEM